MKQGDGIEAILKKVTREGGMPIGGGGVWVETWSKPTKWVAWGTGTGGAKDGGFQAKVPPGPEMSEDGTSLQAK